MPLVCLCDTYIGLIKQTLTVSLYVVNNSNVFEEPINFYLFRGRKTTYLIHMFSEEGFLRLHT